MNVEYASSFEKRVINLEAKGEKLEVIDLVVPTIVERNEKFIVKICTKDKNGFPCKDIENKITIYDYKNEALLEVQIPLGEFGMFAINDVEINVTGTFRYSAEYNGKRYYSNPVVCKENAKQRIYWGDPHIHTLLGNCMTEYNRSYNFAYIGQKWLSMFDWISITDHVSNGRFNWGSWINSHITCEQFNEPNRFVTLHGYEASFKAGAGGDNNIYSLEPIEEYFEDFDDYDNPNLCIENYENGTVKTVVEELENRIDKNRNSFFAVPHHTTRAGKHGEISDEIYPGERLMPLIEIHSRWGTSEYRGNPDALDKIHDGPSYAVDMLNRGLKLGFIGGSDTHSTYTFINNLEHLNHFPGITAVKADKLERKSVFEALKGKDCYAAKLERIYLDVEFSINKDGSRRFKIEAAAKSDIDSIDVVRNGDTIHSFNNINNWKADFEFADDEPKQNVVLHNDKSEELLYYYIRVNCKNGAQAWYSPIWVD